jgi:hypothetical protein
VAEALNEAAELGFRAFHDLPAEETWNIDHITVGTRGVLLAVLRSGTVSTNAFLRKVHNFAVDMNWLPATVIPRRQWPAIRRHLSQIEGPPLD